MSKQKIFNMAVVALIPVLFAACTVSYSFSGAKVSAGASTFSVDYFENRASIVQPTLSQELTDGLIDQVKRQTSLEYSTDVGDLIFSGEITEYSNRPLTASAANEAATNRFTITIKVVHENMVEPEKGFDQSFSRFEDYSSNLDFSSVESELSESIVELLIEDIFNKAFVTW
jgi:hypothetical protein